MFIMILIVVMLILGVTTFMWLWQDAVHEDGNSDFKRHAYFGMALVIGLTVGVIGGLVCFL